jgi:asparagine synthase (glutamine-hydrolysing)
MSAVYGALAAPGRTLDPADLAAMGPALERWGVDLAAGPLTDHAVALGPSPRLTADGDVVVVADARIDNRTELCRELDIPTAEASGLADDELILRAYRHWGADCAARLAGAFAFAVWDARRSTLVLARDHLGLRPLFYRQAADRFLFATDVEAILACPGVPRIPDETAVVADFVEHYAILRERSFYSGIAKVAPGERLTIRPGATPERTAYWVPGPREPLVLARPEDYAEALRDALTVAVEATLRTDRKVAAHLSGGLDSAAVALLAHDQLTARGAGLARGFSWSPPPRAGDPEGDERGRVLALAAAMGIPVTWMELTPADLQAHFERDVALAPSQATVYEHQLLPGAAADGIGVILSGWGGDEVASYSGYGHVARLVRSGRPLAVWREAAAIARRRGRRGAGILRSVAAQTAGSLAWPVRSRLAARRELRDDLVDWAAVHPDAPGLRREAERLNRAPLEPRAAQIANLAGGHLAIRAEAWAHAAAPFGVDYRFPLLDRRLIDLCLSFPADVWYRGGYNRWVFRTAIAPLLPASLGWADFKDEPARLGSFAAPGIAGWEPEVREGMPEIATLIAEHRRQVRAARARRSAPPAAGLDGGGDGVHGEALPRAVDDVDGHGVRGGGRPGEDLVGPDGQKEVGAVDVGEDLADRLGAPDMPDR